VKLLSRDEAWHCGEYRQAASATEVATSLGLRRMRLAKLLNLLKTRGRDKEDGERD